MSGDKEAIYIKLNDVIFPNDDLDKTLIEEDSRFLNVSFARGSERNSSGKKCRGFCSFIEAFGENAPPKKRLSFETSDVSDSDFFDSDAGKEMIIRDQEIMEQEVTLWNNDVDCTGCSSWVPMTSKKLTNLSVTIDTSKAQLCISVGEYIKKRSEYIGHLSDDLEPTKEFFRGCDASTPARIKSEVSSIDKKIAALTDFSKWTVSEHHDYRPTCENSPPPPPPKFLYSVTPRKHEYPDPLHYFIGTTCYKNIQKLKEKERIQNKNWLSLTNQTFETSRNSRMNSCFGNETSFLELSKTNTNRNSPEEWTVHPEEIVLDVTKGSRVELINNSNRNIKFKAKFDVHVINVCPLFGTVRAKDVLGLRILVSRSSKIRREDTETYVKIISGRWEKTIHVKLLSNSNSRISVKDRSFILY